VLEQHSICNAHRARAGIDAGIEGRRFISLLFLPASIFLFISFFSLSLPLPSL